MRFQRGDKVRSLTEHPVSNKPGTVVQRVVLYPAVLDAEEAAYIVQFPGYTASYVFRASQLEKWGDKPREWQVEVFFHKVMAPTSAEARLQVLRALGASPIIYEADWTFEILDDGVEEA